MADHNFNKSTANTEDPKLPVFNSFMTIQNRLKRQYLRNEKLYRQMVNRKETTEYLIYTCSKVRELL